MEPHWLYDQNIDNLLIHIEQTQNAYYVAMDIVNFVHILIFMVSIFVYFVRSNNLQRSFRGLTFNYDHLNTTLTFI